MRKSRFTEEQIIALLKRVEQGQVVADACREAGIGEGTSYRWKAQYGGLETLYVNTFVEELCESA